MFENPNVNQKLDKEAAEDEAVNMLLEYTIEEGITKAEFNIAYPLSLGISLEEQNVTERPREEVFALAEKLEEFSDNGFAISRIPALIDVTADLDKDSEVFDEYAKFIVSLNTSEREKEILTSLGLYGRAGTLTITNADTMKSTVIVTPPRDGEDPLYKQIQHTIDTLGEGEFEVMFES